MALSVPNASRAAARFGYDADVVQACQPGDAAAGEVDSNWNSPVRDGLVVNASRMSYECRYGYASRTSGLPGSLSASVKAL